MFEGTYRIADIVVRIVSIHQEVHTICKGYESSDDVELTVEVLQSDIDFERNKSLEEDRLEGRTSYNYSDSYLETLAVYRKIAVYISFHNSCLFHGALIELNGEGYLFTALSGTGKTTHVRNWLKMYPSARIINGDKPILRLRDNTIIGYGTPWCGKEGYQVNSSVPLKAVILLERGKSNSICRINAGEAISFLLDQCYRSNDSMGVKRALDMCAKITESVELYRLACNMDVDSARIAYLGINSNDF